MSKIAIALFGGSEVEGYSAPVGTHWRFSLAGGEIVSISAARTSPKTTPSSSGSPRCSANARSGFPRGTKVDLGGFVLLGSTSSKVQPGNGETNNSISIRFYALAGGVSVESD